MKRWRRKDRSEDEGSQRRKLSFQRTQEEQAAGCRKKGDDEEPNPRATLLTTMSIYTCHFSIKGNIN